MLPVTVAWLIVKLALITFVMAGALAVICFPEPAAVGWIFVKVTRPFPALVPISMLVEPCSVPVPALSVRGTFRLAGKPVGDSFPNWARLASPGCGVGV